MEINKVNNTDKDKLDYLLKNIFITSTNSESFNSITIKDDIDKLNINTIKVNLNKQILQKISSYKYIILFGKKYKSETYFKFLFKFNKLIYFCYRKNIYPINTRLKVPLTRDSGWGCMIRCGQMIMSRGLVKYFKSKLDKDKSVFSETLKFFVDIPYKMQNIPNLYFPIMTKNPYINSDTKILAPFSIQMHCCLGNKYNKYGGEWFSDVNVCQNYRDINNILNIIPDLKIFSFISELNMGEVTEGCFEQINNNESNNNNNEIISYNNKKYLMKKSGLIFVSVRLGLNKVSKEYFLSIKNLFHCKRCLGIIGGETNLAHYFIGYNDKGNLLYLDPHITRDAINVLNCENIYNDYLTKNLHEISMNDMSTALSIGFLFRNKKEFEDLNDFLEIYCKTDFPCFGLSKEKIELDVNKYENLFNDEDDF